MLQQILQDMYIDPELLAELSDEQKALLFVKMREEQVRRWKENEEKAENEEKKKPKKPHKPGKKKVSFLKGNDGNEWVWVMGEHRNDKAIEQILEEEAQQEAIKEAEKEMEELRIKEEQDMQKIIEEEKKRLETEQKRKDEELKRQQEEAALYQSLKEARLMAQKMEEEKKKQEEVEKRHIEELRLKACRKCTDLMEFTQKRQSLERIKKNSNRRSSDIYIQWKENRAKMEKMAEENSFEMESNWKEQEKKAKQAETQLREVARQARMEYRNSLQHSMNVVNAVSAFSNSVKKEKPPLPPKNTAKLREKIAKKKRPQRPPDKASVIQWFLEEERPRHSGIDPGTGKVALWFHGIITRLDAENILINHKPGSYLVRVSERVWGYTISYRADDRCKHFLIDTSEEGYQFFGANQVQHQNLYDLIKFHHLNPITVAGKERLLHPVGQQKDTPDYEEIMKPRVTESTSL